MSGPTEKRKSKRRWYRFSLRTLLLVMLLLGCGLIPFAVRMERARQQKAAVEWILNSGGRVLYEYETDGDDYPVFYDEPDYRAKKPQSLQWLRKRLGDDFFHSVVAVSSVKPRDRNWVEPGELSFPEFARIHDVSGLRGLRNLQYLDLQHTAVRDLSPLAGLAKLRYLDLSGTRVSDLSPLRGLRDLRYLHLSHTLVRDVSALKGLTNLEQVGLGHTPVDDIAALRGLVNLEGLELSETRVHDISSLEGLTKLKGLGLDRTRVSDVSVLGKLTKLAHLTMQDTPVNDVSTLKHLTKLAYLELRGTEASGEQLRDLQRALPNCQILDVPHIDIDDVFGAP